MPRLILLSLFVLLGLFSLLSPHHVAVTKLVTISKTGTIAMTNEQLIETTFGICPTLYSIKRVIVERVFDDRQIPLRVVNMVGKKFSE